MIKLLLLAFLVMVPGRSDAASRKLGGYTDTRVSRIVDEHRTTVQNRKKKCEVDDDCKTNCSGYRYCDPAGDFICRRGYCSPNSCSADSNCEDDQRCNMTSNTCEDLTCNATKTETYYAGTSTITQYILNHQCKFCDAFVGTDSCPCEFCTNAGCTGAATGCGIDGRGYTYKIECTSNEVLIGGECVACAARVTGCSQCTLGAASTVECTKCSDGSTPIDNLCSNEYVECTSNSDCTNDKMCNSEHKCVLPPSVKDPTVLCQLTNGEYANHHTCNSCASDNSCAECFENGSGAVICNRCADGFEFNTEGATSCVPSDCANHGLHSSCGPDTVAVPDATYTSCYACEDPVAGGLVACEVGELHYHVESGKYCCE